MLFFYLLIGVCLVVKAVPELISVLAVVNSEVSITFFFALNF